MLSSNALCNCNSFLLSLVSEHRTANYVSNSPNVSEVSFTVLINDDSTSLVKLQSDCLRLESNSVGYSTNRYDQFVELCSLRLAACSRVRNRNTFFRLNYLSNFNAELNFEALFNEYFVGFLGNLLVRRP